MARCIYCVLSDTRHVNCYTLCNAVPYKLYTNAPALLTLSNPLAIAVFSAYTILPILSFFFSPQQSYFLLVFANGRRILFGKTGEKDILVVADGERGRESNRATIQMCTPTLRATLFLMSIGTLSRSFCDLIDSRLSAYDCHFHPPGFKIICNSYITFARTHQNIRKSSR